MNKYEVRGLKWILEKLREWVLHFNLKVLWLNSWQYTISLMVGLTTVLIVGLVTF